MKKLTIALTNVAFYAAVTGVLPVTIAIVFF